MVLNTDYYFLGRCHYASWYKCALVLLSDCLKLIPRQHNINIVFIYCPLLCILYLLLCLLQGSRSFTLVSTLAMF